MSSVSGSVATQALVHAQRMRWLHSAFMLALLAVVLSSVNPAWAGAPTGKPDDGIALLARMQEAARKLDYSGVFMYTQGDFTQSSRVTHMIDGTGSRERLEILDGEAREFIRHNDDVQHLMPERKKILIDRRRTDRFPGVLLGDPAGLAQNYDIDVRPGKQRVAGRECQVIHITPRDGSRYGHKLCADLQTNLLLKAQTLDSERAVIEQVMFTSLRIGGDIPAESLQSSWSTQGWEVTKLAMLPVDLVSKGWRVPPPKGFLPVMQVERVMGQSDRVEQLVFSDGLAAISVFIEPYDQRGSVHKKPGAARMGAINIFATRIADFWLTALGEVPVGTLRDLAESTEYVPSPK